MRALFVSLCSYFIIFLNGIDASNIRSLTKSSTEFGWNLLRKLGQNSNENVFISPLSVQMALTLVLQGSKGLSANELKTLLHYNTIADEAINEEIRNINALLNTAPNARYSLSLANRLYLQYGITLKRPFQSVVQQYYSGGIDLVDFVNNPKLAEDVINKWVSDQTKGKIPSIVSDLTPDTVLIIVNAIYFKGDWAKKFDEGNTKADSFTTISGSPTTVNMMTLREEKFYYDEDKKLNFKIIELPYSGEDLSMFIILPNEGSSLFELENLLSDAEKLENIIQNMDEAEISILKLPRIKLEMKYGLVPVLKSMGLDSLFTSNADLSGIYGEPGNIAVSDVIHKTFLEINEEGSEAAGASAVEITNRMGGGPYKAEFIANRPFIFFIRDNRSNLILFLGHITNPQNV